MRIGLFPKQMPSFYAVRITTLVNIRVAAQRPALAVHDDISHSPASWAFPQLKLSLQTYQTPSFLLNQQNAARSSMPHETYGHFLWRINIVETILFPHAGFEGVFYPTRTSHSHGRTVLPRSIGLSSNLPDDREQNATRLLSSPSFSRLNTTCPGKLENIRGSQMKSTHLPRKSRVPRTEVLSLSTFGFRR